MKLIIRTRQWWLATSTAATYYRQNRGLKYLIKLAWWMLWKITRSILLADICTRKEWFHRMLACARCPLYNRSLQSCGIVDVEDSNHNQLGCLCWMPLKAVFKSSKCWLEEAGYDDIPWHV